MDPRLIRRVRRRDRIANWVITAGGIFVIVCVLGILVLIARVALPLFAPPSVELFASPPNPVAGRGQPVLAVGVDEYRETAFTLTADGTFTFFHARQGDVLDTVTVTPPGADAPGHLRQVEPYGRQHYSLLWEDGALTVVRVVFRPRFAEDGTRTIVPEVERLAEQAPAPGEAAAVLSVGRYAEDAGLTRASVLADGTLRLHKQVVSTNLFGQSTVEDVEVTLADDIPGTVTHLLLTSDGNTLYAATDSAYLLRWDVRDPEAVRLLERIPAFEDGRRITTLGLLLGEYTLIVGDDRGGVTGWFPYQHGQEGPLRLDLVHRIMPHDSPVVAIAPSLRAKSAVTLDADGIVHFDHFTNERHLLTLEHEPGLVTASLNTRGDALIGLDRAGQVLIWEVDMPHPEVSWGTYFGRVWYESYPEPAFVWQSAGSTEDFEPKLSLIPLIFGTLKGTFYGMLFAAPLGVLGAMYTSSLMHPRLRGYIKPVFETMASVPTVVIGFLAALWLAPLVKASLTGMFLILGVLPLTIIAGMAAFERLQGLGLFRKLVRGYEFVFMLPVIVVGVWLALMIGSGLDAFVFGGGLPDWLFNQWGVRVDQRNSIIISMALGFAVLPIVYSISDDALANVPRNLTAASLALGASRWQTVWRVILPSASPGIFAALMVGFGRAVGETMIVLMATGNTPILDWSVFNGMRTLSANIAVEIPEAPEGGTLYRTLFLSAVLLFVTTFVLNSVAEVVRIRLRRKFGQS